MKSELVSLILLIKKYFFNFPFYWQPSRFFSAHSVGSGCPAADVTTVIIKPKLEDIFRNRKAQIICHVTVHMPDVKRIWWEDEDKNELATSPDGPIGVKKSLSLSLDITYDEWSQGKRRYCFVEHTLWLEPQSKTYERSVGENVSIISSNILSVPLQGLTVVSYLQKEKFSVLQCSCCLR